MTFDPTRTHEEERLLKLTTYNGRRIRVVQRRTMNYVLMTAVGSCVKLNDDYTRLPSSSFPLPPNYPWRTTAFFFPCYGMLVGIHVDDSIAPAISGIFYATVLAIIEYLLFPSPFAPFSRLSIYLSACTPFLCLTTLSLPLRRV